MGTIEKEFGPISQERSEIFMRKPPPKKKGAGSSFGQDYSKNRSNKHGIAESYARPSAKNNLSRPTSHFDDEDNMGFDHGHQSGQRGSNRGHASNGGSPNTSAGSVGRVRVTLYGMHAVCAAIRNPERQIRAIYAVEPDDPALISALSDALEEGLDRPRVTRVEKETLHKSVPREAVHQGIGCDASQLDDVYLSDVLKQIDAKGRGVIVMLDQVTDPHNIGAILRSAAAFGADALVVQSRNAPDMNALIAKTACGGAEIVPIITETNLSRAIETMQKSGFFALALDERGRGTLAEAPDYEKTLLVLGAEGPGLRPLIREKCDILVRLPTESHFSSLNVSNAAAISLYGIAIKAKK